MQLRFEVTYELANGNTGQRFVLAPAEATDEQVLQRFRDEWSQYGDQFIGSAWISARWSFTS